MTAGKQRISKTRVQNWNAYCESLDRLALDTDWLNDTADRAMLEREVDKLARAYGNLPKSDRDSLRKGFMEIIYATYGIYESLA